MTFHLQHASHDAFPSSQTQGSPWETQALQGPFQMPLAFPYSKRLVLRFFWFYTTHLGSLIPDQPHIHGRRGRTTYFQVPIPPGTGHFWHPHLALQQLHLGDLLSCCFVPLLLDPLRQELHVPLVLLPSFLLSPLPCLILGLFLFLILCLLSCLLLPSYLFHLKSPNLHELPLKLLFEVVFHSDLFKGGEVAVRSKKLSEIHSLPKPYIHRISDHTKDLPMGHKTLRAWP